MRNIDLWVQNDGLREVEIAYGSTLADLAKQECLEDHDFTVDNKLVERTAWARTALDDVSELWASKGAKGA